MTFKDVKVGDQVTRLLAEKIPMKLNVSEVTETLIITHGGWQFERENGVEYDEDLQWGTKWGYTGSYLVKEDTSQDV